MKHRVWPLILLVLTALAWFWLGRDESTVPLPTINSTPAAARPVATTPPPVASEPTAPPAAPEPAPPDEKPKPSPAERVIVERVHARIREFGNRFGGNPEGTNAEITKALDGGNPKGVRFLEQEDLRLNELGELLDPWGSPYFFHQLSAREMEIRSAGPDRQMWTSDDPLVK